MSQVRNKRLLIKLYDGNPHSTFINGIGYMWIDLRDSQVECRPNGIASDIISFSENKQEILSALKSAAKKIDDDYFVEATVTGQLGKCHGNPFTLNIFHIKFDFPSER